MDERVVEVRRELAAPPETVFAYLTDPALYTRWMGRAAVLDPRPGGTYRVEIDEHNIALGAYVTVEPPSRLVFTWGWQGSLDVPPGSTEVEITLEAIDHGTALVLRHTGLPDDATTALHGEGWEHYTHELSASVSELRPT